MLNLVVFSSTATSILPPGPPPLFPFRTVKGWLPQLLINLIVRVAQPVPEFVPAAGSNLLLFDVVLEVISAYPARV